MGAGIKDVLKTVTFDFRLFFSRWSNKFGKYDKLFHKFCLDCLNAIDRYRFHILWLKQKHRFPAYKIPFVDEKIVHSQTI